MFSDNFSPIFSNQIVKIQEKIKIPKFYGGKQVILSILHVCLGNGYCDLQQAVGNESAAQKELRSTFLLSMAVWKLKWR